MRRRMPRQLDQAIVLLVVAVAMAISGTATASAQSPAGTSRVSFMVFGDPAELAAYEALVTTFEASHPQVDVELVHVPGQADYRARLGADFAAGAPADVVLVNYRRYAPFAARDLLEPLGPYLRQSSIIDEADFYPEALAPFRWKGILECIPQNLSSLVVYYNADLFDAAGLPYPEDDWTWDEFLAAALTLTRDLDGDGRTDQFGLGTEASIFRLAPFIWQNGGELVVLDEGRTPIRLAVDSRAARAAIEWFVDLQVRHHVVPDAIAEQAQDSESRFIGGTTAMYLDSRRGVPTYRTISGFEWDVAPLPRRDETAAPAGILHSDAFCLPAVARDKAAAWSLIEFAASAEGQAILATSGRTVPSLRAVAESEAFLDPEQPPASSDVFLRSIADLRAVPVTPAWVDVEEVAGDELERAFYGVATVDEAIAAMIARTTPFFSGAEG